MNRTTAQWLVACGWIAALISALLTIYIVSLGESPLALIEAVILLAFGYGIYRKSRVCAVVALVYFIIEKLLWYRFLLARVPTHSPVLTQFWVPAIFFIVLYALGVAGTFYWHAAAAAGLGPDADRRHELRDAR
ncbi:MAG: hypothetical protein ACREQ4_13835 [Candidatus Binataceae bacterium]